jgi:Argininosuccinate lyase
MTNKNKTVWSSRFKNSTSQSFQRIGASINVDKRLYEQDIFASKIHTKMLIQKKIIPTKEGKQIL